MWSINRHVLYRFCHFQSGGVVQVMINVGTEWWGRKIELKLLYSLYEEGVFVAEILENRVLLSLRVCSHHSVFVGLCFGVKKRKLRESKGV